MVLLRRPKIPADDPDNIIGEDDHPIERPEDLDTYQANATNSAEQLKIWSIYLTDHETIGWQRLGKLLGVLAFVAVIGVIAITPIGGVSLVAFLSGLALHGTVLAIATAAPAVVAVSACVGSFFAIRKSQQPTGVALSILDVSTKARENAGMVVEP